MDGLFYILVWIAGLVFLLIILILYLTHRINKLIWYMFWIGFIIGMCWELPMSIANELAICCGYPYPPATFNTPTPIQGPLLVIIIAVTHSLWDGTLFLFSVSFVYLFSKAPYFTEFNWKQLGILLLIGQLQEFIVELVSTSSSGWYYNIYWFNPPLFPWMGHFITLLPQLIWLLAPIVFYVVVLKYQPKLV